MRIIVLSACCENRVEYQENDEDDDDEKKELFKMRVLLFLLFFWKTIKIQKHFSLVYR